MKVYDWKLLILTVIIGFGGILYHLFDLFNGGDMSAVAKVLLFSYASYQGLKTTLTEEGYLKDKENRRRNQIINQRLFGRFAPLVLSVYLVLLIASVVTLLIRPEKIRLSLWLFVRSLVYAAVIIVLIYMEDEKLKAEEDAEKEQQNING